MIPTNELIVLDTNILVAYARANKLASYIETKFELRKRTERPLICIVSIGEIRALTRKFNWGEAKCQALESFLSDLVSVDISSDAVLDYYAEFRHYLYSLKPSITIQQNDIWIAAVSAAAGAHLISTDSDLKHLGSLIKLHWIDESLAI